MEKQIINRGYVTYALTNGKDKVFGMIKDSWISDWSREHPLYWSEVYCEPGVRALIIRKNMLLVGKTNKELCELHEQSKINLN